MGANRHCKVLLSSAAVLMQKLLSLLKTHSKGTVELVVLSCWC